MLLGLIVKGNGFPASCHQMKNQGENNNHYKAFELLLSMTGRRSLKALADKLSLKEYPIPDYTYTSLQQFSKKFNWLQRAEDFDSWYYYKLNREEARKTQIKKAENLAKFEELRDEIYNALSEKKDQLLNDGNLNMREVTKLLKIMTDITNDEALVWRKFSELDSDKL